MQRHEQHALLKFKQACRKLPTWSCSLATRLLYRADDKAFCLPQVCTLRSVLQLRQLVIISNRLFWGWRYYTRLPAICNSQRPTSFGYRMLTETDPRTLQTLPAYSATCCLVSKPQPRSVRVERQFAPEVCCALTRYFTCYEIRRTLV